MKKKAALFWSGGKDSAFALYQMKQEYPGYELCYLVTTVNKEYRRISMHGVRETLLEQQAQSTGIPLIKMEMENQASNQAYEDALSKTFTQLKELGITHIVYGDIFLEDLKRYREHFLNKHQLEGIFPLWKKDTRKLISTFLATGFKTMVCCISSKYLTEAHVGKCMDERYISTLPPEVDPCGENGEFHTFCFEGPVFHKPIRFHTGAKEYRPLTVSSATSEHETGFWFIDLLPEKER